MLLSHLCRRFFWNRQLHICGLCSKHKRQVKDTYRTCVFNNTFPCVQWHSHVWQPIMNSLWEFNQTQLCAQITFISLPFKAQEIICTTSSPSSINTNTIISKSLAQPFPHISNVVILRLASHHKGNKKRNSMARTFRMNIKPVFWFTDILFSIQRTVHWNPMKYLNVMLITRVRAPGSKGNDTECSGFGLRRREREIGLEVVKTHLWPLGRTQEFSLEEGGVNLHCRHSLRQIRAPLLTRAQPRTNTHSASPAATTS